MKGKQDIIKAIGKTVKDIQIIEAHGFLSHQEVVVIYFTDGTKLTLKGSYHI